MRALEAVNHIMPSHGGRKLIAVIPRLSAVLCQVTPRAIFQTPSVVVAQKHRART